MRNFTSRINTIEDVKTFEKVSPKCSSKYVPIKTSDFIKAMDGKFDFVGGKQYQYASSAHSVTLEKGEGLQVYIENSFDRSMSLRVSFKYNEFIFGRIKQVHIGQGAQELAKMSNDITKWYDNASGAINTLRNMTLPLDVQVEIAKIAFKARGVDLAYIRNLEYNSNNALEFIEYIVQGIKEGDFFRTDLKTGKLKTLQKVKSQYLVVKINNEIWEYISDEYPELYI